MKDEKLNEVLQNMLQHLLGHQRIDTTMQYAMVKQSNVKLAHKKYIG